MAQAAPQIAFHVEHHARGLVAGCGCGWRSEYLWPTLVSAQASWRRHVAAVHD